jgi:hypothetical protein
MAALKRAKKEFVFGSPEHLAQILAAKLVPGERSNEAMWLLLLELLPAGIPQEAFEEAPSEHPIAASDLGSTMSRRARAIDGPWSNITAPPSFPCVAARRRRPGHAGQHRGQGHRAQGAPPLQREASWPASPAARPMPSRCSSASRPSWRSTRATAARRRRTGQGLAHRPHALRRLEAMLAVADREHSLIITGNGDVLEPEHGIVAIGSGGAYAQSAARALLENTELTPARSSRSR